MSVNSLAGWNIPRKALDLIKVVGHGEFGGTKNDTYVGFIQRFVFTL